MAVFCHLWDLSFMDSTHSSNGVGASLLVVLTKTWLRGGAKFGDCNDLRADCPPASPAHASRSNSSSRPSWELAGRQRTELRRGGEISPDVGDFIVPTARDTSW